MHHADHFAKRILFLEGFPNMQMLDPLRIGQTVEEIIKADLATETPPEPLHRSRGLLALSINDRVSEERFKGEKGHIDVLETQFELIKRLGAQLYSQKRFGGLDS